MEFYKNAIYMRTEISKWMMRDFGVKRNHRRARNETEQEKDTYLPN